MRRITDLVMSACMADALCRQTMAAAVAKKTRSARARLAMKTKAGFFSPWTSW